jgi:hypothetical protein
MHLQKILMHGIQTCFHSYARIIKLPLCIPQFRPYFIVKILWCQLHYLNIKSSVMVLLRFVLVKTSWVGEDTYLEHTHSKEFKIKFTPKKVVTLLHFVASE